MNVNVQTRAAHDAIHDAALPARIVEIRSKTIPFKVNIRNAATAVSELTTSIVAVITDVVRNGKPVVGYAFSSTGRPAPELQIAKRFIPRLMNASPAVALDRDGFDPERFTTVMNTPEKPGGDAERSVGIGTLEIALWDAAAKIADVPAYRLIGERYRGGDYDAKVFCYVGCGWYVPGTTVQDLKDEVKSYLDKGFTLIKIKVGGAPVDEDVRRIEACLEVLGDPSRLCVDANGGIPANLTPDFARAFKPFKLRWFEEPEPPHDYKAIADFVSAYGEAVAAGENLYSPIDVLNLARFGGLRPGKDVIQWNVTQNYGISNAAKILGMLAKEGWSSRQVVPHSGNQMALNAASGLGFGMCEYYLDAFGVFGGFVDGLKVEDGYVTMGDWPGFGFERQAGLWDVMKQLTK
jgi:L-alanine-DL-glutamate epimerase-like enolase superfamily enzyme